MAAVEIVEVGPRDGLQNEKVMVSTAAKVELARRAIAAGVRRLEVTSFVNPARVPQMADAEEVVKLLGRPEGVTRIGLVLILRAEKSATVKKINATAGESLAVDAIILELE